MSKKRLSGCLFTASLVACCVFASCNCDEKEGPIRLVVAPEERDFAASFNDFATQPNKFVAWWGPHAATACAVDMKVHRAQGTHVEVNPPEVDDPGAVAMFGADRLLLEIGEEPCAYTIYLDGDFRGEPDPGFRAQSDARVKAKMIPVWPIVYTHRVKVGATGTKFFVHVDGNKHIIGRLKGGTGTLYVNRIDDGVDTATIQPSANEDRYLVYIAETDPGDPMPEFGVPLTPGAGSPEEAIFAEVRRRHQAHQGSYPPIPDNPASP